MPSLRRKAAPAHTSHSESSLSSAPESEDIDFGEKTGRSETALPSRPRRRGKRESATSTPAVAPIKKSARPQRRAARPAVKEEDSEDTFDEEKIVVNEEHITVENEANGAEAHVSEFEAEVDIKKKISKTRSPKKAGQRGKAQVKTEVVGEIKEEVFEVRTTTPKKSPKKRKAKQEAAQDQEEKPKVKRKRKTQEEKDAEAMPIAARTLGSKMYIGAHVSAAKGVQNAVTNAVYIGGNAFALFLKSQRKWQNPALSSEHADLFIANCREHKFDATSHVVPHGSYLVNLAQKEPERAAQAYDCFLEDLQRCESLGIKLYNFHPGSTGPHPRSEAIARIADALNRAHSSTKRVQTLLENMAGRGNVIGSRFEDLRDIIALVKDKSRVGVCLDTCHAFAAGYDLRTPAAFKETLATFDATIGLPYLRALHLNDSKAPFAAHRDLHQNIGLGFLGLRAFWNVANEARFEGLPLVLETPIDRDGKEDKGIWAREIKLIESMVGMDMESAEFLRLEKELADEGAEERKKHQEAYERKLEKERKVAAKLNGKPKGKKKGQESDTGEESALSESEDES